MIEHERNWRLLRDFHHRRIPPHILDWLLDAESLTQRVRALCAEKMFKVRLLDQTYRYLTQAQAGTMRLQPGLRVLERQVHLCCGEKPLVYACSLLPETVFIGRAQRLKYQGSKSLGATLFADPSVTRGPLQIIRLDAKQIPGADADGSEEVWGRRSIFYLQKQPLMVAEFYLPQLFK